MEPKVKKVKVQIENSALEQKQGDKPKKGPFEKKQKQENKKGQEVSPKEFVDKKLTSDNGNTGKKHYLGKRKAFDQGKGDNNQPKFGKNGSWSRGDKQDQIQSKPNHVKPKFTDKRNHNSSNNTSANKPKHIVFEDNEESEAPPKSKPQYHSTASNSGNANKKDYLKGNKSKKPFMKENNHITFGNSENDAKPTKGGTRKDSWKMNNSKKPSQNKHIKFDDSEGADVKLARVDSKKDYSKKLTHNKHIKFDNPEEEDVKPTGGHIEKDNLKVNNSKKPNQNKHIKFDDPENEKQTEGDVKKDNSKKPNQNKHITFSHAEEEDDNKVGGDVEDYFESREKQASTHDFVMNEQDQALMKWYEVFESLNDKIDAATESEVNFDEVLNKCHLIFKAEEKKFFRRNGADSNMTLALARNGTAKDKMNANAALITMNPLGNLAAIHSLVQSCKLGNTRFGADLINTISALWTDVLLPSDRKLISLRDRASFIQNISSTIRAEPVRKRIIAYFYFENQLKDIYAEYLQNVQTGLLKGKEDIKKACIVNVAKLLKYSPERESMLLNMLSNKLGDPEKKIGAGALYQMLDVIETHPNMCMEFVNEIERILFRPNISLHAKHYALCFLADVAGWADSTACSRIIRISIALFKILVQEGGVNSRTMLAILRCLKQAVKPSKHGAEPKSLIDDETRDTIYRLLHFGNIQIAVQTLAMLIQIIQGEHENKDRFYNALYKKLLDPEIPSTGTKTLEMLLHVVHQAMDTDPQFPRVVAYVKRMLQIALATSPSMAAGCLIIVHKLMQSRRELVDAIVKANAVPTVEVPEQLPAEDTEKTVGKRNQYDPFARVPTYAGAENANVSELTLLLQHYHPTIQKFADAILHFKPLTYYGNPLKDFHLSHFLERFSFKNPKKSKAAEKDEGGHHKKYKPYGSRGMPVEMLSEENCFEDEKFIFQYLNLKRHRSQSAKKQKENESDSENEGLPPKADDVSDTEFDDFLDSYYKSPKEDDSAEINFINGIDGKKRKDVDSDEESWMDDDEVGGSEDEDEDEDENEDEEQDDDEVDDIDEIDEDEEAGSVAEFDDDEDNDDDDDSDNDNDEDASDGNELDNLDDSEMDGSSDEEDSTLEQDMSDVEDEPVVKKRKVAKAHNEKDFQKKLKSSTDMSGLFASVDNFSEYLETTGKEKGHGTTNALFNRDKSSAKQLKWEAKRNSNKKKYGKPKKMKRS